MFVGVYCVSLMHRVQRKRKDLRLVVSSATLDAEEMKQFFETNTTDDTNQDTAAIISIEGRTFPVGICATKYAQSQYQIIFIVIRYSLPQSLVFRLPYNSINHSSRHSHNPATRRHPCFPYRTRRNRYFSATNKRSIW